MAEEKKYKELEPNPAPLQNPEPDLKVSIFERASLFVKENKFAILQTLGVVLSFFKPKTVANKIGKILTISGKGRNAKSKD